jgi:transcriptional regulator with XRE-family HTH domain
VLVKSRLNQLILDLSNMKVTQSTMLSPRQQDECVRLGQLLARLRIARKVKQTDAALRAGLSRNTVYRLEKGDPGLAMGQVLRYLEAIAPGTTLLELLSEQDPALLALAAREKTRRVRDLSAAELQELDF